MQKYFQIGEIVNVHGINGELKIYPSTDDANRFKKLDDILISSFPVNHKGFDEKALISYEIQSFRIHKNMVLIKLRNINSREAAIKLKGKKCIVHRDNAVKLPKDSYFIADLIGCTVNDNKRGLLGKIYDVIKTGSNDVYCVKGPFGVVLIPVLKTVVKKVDIEKQIIDVELLEGLIDD